MRPTFRWGLALVAAVAAICGVAAPAAAQSETVEYYGVDAIGSVRIVFDANGNIVARMDYTPFGQELFAGTNMPDRRYAGLFRDGEAGLDSAGARSYQSRTGRFSSVDPIYAGLFEPQRWNRYVYALNSPANLTDPSGLLPDACKPMTTFNDSGDGFISVSHSEAPNCVSAEMRGFVMGLNGSPGFGWSIEPYLGGAGASMSAPRSSSWMTSTTPPNIAAAEAEIIALAVQPVTMSAVPVKTQSEGDQQLNAIAGQVANSAGPLTKPSTYAQFYLGSAVVGIGGQLCLAACSQMAGAVGNAGYSSLAWTADAAIRVEIAVPGAIAGVHDFLPTLVTGPVTPTSRGSFVGALYSTVSTWFGWPSVR